LIPTADVGVVIVSAVCMVVNSSGTITGVDVGPKYCDQRQIVVVVGVVAVAIVVRVVVIVVGVERKADGNPRNVALSKCHESVHIHLQL